MLNFYLSEFGIHVDAFPTEFTKYEERAISKWTTLKHLVYKDVLKYMIPFILESERESFCKFINSEFSTFCCSHKCDYNYISCKNKTLALLVLHAQVPETCKRYCCFRFHLSPLMSSSKRKVCVLSNGCGEYFSKSACDTTEMMFNKWLFGKQKRRCTISMPKKR